HIARVHGGLRCGADPDELGRLLQGTLGPSHQGNASAARRQLEGDSGTDAAPRPGYQCNLAVQTVHPSSSGPEGRQGVDSNEDLDGALTRVRLQPSDAAFYPDARLPVSADRQDARSRAARRGGGGVDHDPARVDRLRKPMRPSEIPGPQNRGQAVYRAVGDARGLLVIPEGENREYGAEDLFLSNPMHR